MTIFGETAVFDILAEFGGCCHPFQLQPVTFGGEVAIDLGMALHLALVFAENVHREQILRIAAYIGPHGPKQQPIRPAADLGRQFLWHHLDLEREGTSRFMGLTFAIQRQCMISGLADGLETAGPGGAAGVALPVDHFSGRTPGSSSLPVGFHTPVALKLKLALELTAEPRANRDTVEPRFASPVHSNRDVTVPAVGTIAAQPDFQ